MSGLQSLLARAVSDISFRETLLTKPHEAIDQYDLTDQERSVLVHRRLPEGVAPGDGEQFYVFVRIIETFKNVENIAAFPPEIDFSLSPEVERKAAAAKDATSDLRLSALRDLVDEVEGHNRRRIKPVPIEVDPIRVDYDIYIAGLGIAALDQITLEVDRALEKSNQVFYVASGAGIEDYLKTKCETVVDLSPIAYQKFEDRGNAYRTMAVRVIEAALERRGPVTLALYGHPTIFAYPPFLIVQMAKAIGLSVKVLPGVSSMDCLFADLMIDPGMNGLLMYEATDMLLRNRPLIPDVPALIWQVGTLETALYINAPSKPERFARFYKHMMKFYSKDHVVKAYFSSVYPFAPPTVYSFALKDIDSHAEVLHGGFTIYVPPEGVRPLDDTHLADLVTDVAHLKRVADTEKQFD